MSNDIVDVFNSENISKNKLQQLNDLYMLIKKEKLKYIKNDIFLDTVNEASTPNYGIQEILGVKVRDIILRGELISCLQVKKNTISNTEVLLDNFNEIELNFEEQKDLKIVLERRIKEKGDIFLKELNYITDNDNCSLEEVVEHVKFDAKTEQNNLLTIQKQLVEQQKQYIKSLINLGTKLQELVDLKTETGVEIAERKAAEDIAVSEKFNLRCKLLSQQNRLTIFEELPLSIDAYRKAINDLKEQQEECNTEIEKNRTDLDNYKIVSRNEEYQEILKEYKQYKRSLDNKIWICNELNRNKI